MIPGGLSFQFKPGCYSKKHSWLTVSYAGLIGFCKSIRPKAFETGREAIWLKPVLTDKTGKVYPWLILDVESPGADGHSDIAENLEAGREMLAMILEHGLEAGLIIFLSGKGLRFCWPYLVQDELQKAFRAWITDKTAYPMIDPSPFIKKSFYRMFGYRGHANQGKPVDRHIHKLNDINDLWFMDEADYLSMVTGPVNLGTSLEWLQEIVPIGFMPEPWQRFLREYKVRAALEDNIFHPIIPSRKFRKPIRAIADQAGLEYREFEFAHGQILQLKACPICGRRDGRPFLTESGRLKCHHRNSCEAGAVDEQGHIIGVPLSQWLPDYSDDIEEVVTSEETVERISLQAARDALREALEADDDTYVTLSPGAGKSFTSIQSIMAGLKNGTGRIAIATPEHKLNEEFLGLALSMADRPETVHILRGRNKTNCREMAQVEALASKGFSPGVVVCPKCKRLNPDPCPYWTQFECLKHETGLFLMTHSMALEVNMKGIELLLIDESPLKTFFQKQESSVGAMQRIQAKLSKQGREVMEKMLNIIPAQLAAMESAGAGTYDLSRVYVSSPPENSQWADRPTLWELAGITPEERDRLSRDLSMFERWIDPVSGKQEPMAKWQKRLLEKEKVDLKTLRWLGSALSESPGIYIRFSTDATTPAKFVSFQKRLPKYDGRIVCLDATGNPAEAEALFGRPFRHIQGKVEMPGLKTVWIKQATGKCKMNRMDEKQIGDMLKSAAQFLQPADRNVLVVTHLAVEGTVAKLAADVLPGRNIKTCHFWGGSRGVNQYQDCTAVIVLGIPFPNIDGLYDHAMALVTDPVQRMAWIVRAGQSELIQAIHRIRPVKGNRTVIVCGKDFPATEFGDPQIKVNRQRGNKIQESAVSEIVERLTPFVERWGFLTKEIGWAYKVFLLADKAIALQASEFIQEKIKELEKHGDNYLKLLDKKDNEGKGNLPACGYYIKSLLLSKRTQRAYLSLHFLTLTHHSTWEEVLQVLATRFCLPGLRYSSRDTNGQKVTGIGYLCNVRAFYESVGIPFSAESWQGVEAPYRPGE